MKVNLSDYTEKANFWKLYPQLATVGPFKKLYTSDKSSNKALSSRKMWCIAFIWDASSSFYNLPEDISDPDSKIILVYDEYFGKPDYYKKNKEEVEELKRFYLKIHETPAMRSLRELEEQVEERAMFLKETKYTLGELDEHGRFVGGTAEIKDKMMSNTGKIYELLEKARKAVDNEKLMETKNKGGGEESLSDMNEI